MAIKLTSEDWKRLRDTANYREQLRQLSVKDKKYASDYLTKHRTAQELDDYYNNLNDIYGIASNIRDYYKSTGNADYQAMSDYVTELDKVLGGRDTVTQMYGNFADQAAYDAYIKKVTEDAERNEYLRNVDIDALSARLAWLGGKTNQFGTNNTDFLSNPNTMQSLMSDIKNGYTLPTTQAERDQEIAQLQKDIEEARYIQRIAAYESAVNNPDFNKEELLKSRAPSDYWAANPYHYLTDDQMAILNYWDSKEDPNFRDRYDSMAKNLAGLFGPTEGIIPSAPLSAADEYYDYLAPQLRQSVVDEFKTFGQENKHLGTGLSFLTNAGAMVTQPITFLTGDFNSFAAMTTGLREGATADMDAWNAFFYNLAVSGAESAAAAAIPMGLGTIPLAASAAAATQNDILLRGGTEGQAVIGGLLAGGAEAFFESFSIGALADMVKSGSIKTFFKNFMGNFVKEVGTNASEELATELANIVSDEVIMGELSNYNTMVSEYMASGMSEEDAHKKAKQMIVHQIGEAAMSGALMGGGFTLLGSGVNTVSNFATGSAVTRNAKLNDKLNQAGATLSLDVDNEATAEARKLYSKIEGYNEARQNGKKASPLKKAQNRVNVGRFANMLAYDTDVQEALKKLNAGAKQNVSETVKTAEKVSKEANISKDNAEVTKSAMPKIVKAEGQELSQIFIEKDGNVVSLDKVAIEDADLAAAYSYAVTTGSVENANSFLKSYALSSTNASPTAFWSAWMGIAANGQTLKTTEENQAKVFAEYGDVLGDDAKLAAWLSGVTMKQTASERRIKAAEQARAEWEKDGKKVTKAKIDATELQNVELDAKQKEFVAFGRLFAEAFGINVKFVASKKGNRGDNGSYNRTTNTITLDVFAGIGNDANYNAVQSALANTLSHEVVHNMRIVAPEVYDTLSEYVFETLKAQGMDIDSRIQYYIDDAKSDNKTMSREDAIEEIVAHACDGMLRTSETVREFMEGFYAKDKRAANRFTKAVKDVLKRLKDVFESLLGVKAYSAEAHLLYKAGADSVAEIQKIFDQGIANLREGNLARNYQIGMVAEGVTITPDNTIMAQQRQYRETGRASVLEYLTELYGKDTAEDMIATMDRLYDVVDQIKDENPELNIFSQWQETEVELDDEGHPIFTSNIKNGDYPLNQDFSRVCKKRRQLDEVLNWLASNKDFTVAYLTKNDYKKINDIIRDHGFEVACDLCFVDAKRFRQSEWAESFAETWNDLLKSVMVSGNATTFNFATDSMDISATDVVIDPSRQITYRKWSEGKVKETRSYKNLDDFLKNDRNANVKNMMKLIVQNEDMRHTFRAADVISSKGFDSIQRNAPQIRQILNGWGGSSAPKSSSLDSVYDNSILNISGYNQEAAYAVGGVRMNSFSDFIAHMFFDYCQAFADLDAKKLPMQAYSKELTFFLLFGRTGGKLNMSGIPEARTPSNGKYTKLEYEKQFAGLDIEPLLQYLGKPANKLTVEDCLEHLDMLDYLWAKESIDIKKATLLQSGIRFDKLSNDKIDKCYDLILEKKFDEAHSVAGRENVDLEYTKNVGIIAVGVSEPHIRKLLRDHTIRMVIPYHKSGLNPVIAKALHIHTYMDYTNTQSTKIQYKGEAARNLTKDDHIEPFSFYDYFGKTIDGVFYDAKATANRYIQWCQEMSTDKYTIIPKFNEFTNEENYYKLLEDFDCYNTITEAHEAQNAVNFFGDTFPADYKSIITKELKAEQKTRDDFRAELDSTGMRQEILDVVRKRGFKGEADVMRQARRSDKIFQAEYEEAVDDVLNGNYNKDSVVIIGRTPKAFEKIGVNQLPITITPAHIYSIAKTEAEAKVEGRYNKRLNYHGLGEDAVKQIGEKISSPLMILTHQEFTEKQQKEHASAHKIVVLVELQINGKQVICPIEIDAEVQIGSDIYDSNHVATYFDKKNINELIRESIARESIGEVGFYYIDSKKADNLLQDSGYQLPQHLAGQLSASEDIIRHIDVNVNRKIENFLGSRQFTRWFGDWMNHPERASKIVNPDGTPMVVYHGTNADFTIFDINKSSATTKRYIDGFYFTTEEKVAKKIANLVAKSRGGDANVLSVYLDVKNPLVLTAVEYQKIGFNEKWRNEVLNKLTKGNHDGVIIKPENERVAGVFADSYNYDADAAVYHNAEKYGITDKDYAWWLNRAVSNPDFTATQIAVFKPEQVKSATDNIGTYDKENADMLHQKRIETPDPSTLLKDVIRNKVGAKEYGQYTESLKKYQDLDVRARNQEKRIAEIDAEISKLKSEHKQSGKGTRMDELYRMRKTAENKVSEYQKQMFALETRELSGIVRAETEKARLETQRKANERYHATVKSRRMTERRNRLRKIIKELDTLFNRGNKKKNVKAGLANTVETALRLSQTLAFADIGDDEVILANMITSQTDSEQKVIDKYQDVLNERNALIEELDALEDMEDDATKQKAKELKDKISKLNHTKKELADSIRDLLDREKRILSKTKLGTILRELHTAYADLQNAEESFIRQAYSDIVASRIEKAAKELDMVFLKDMTEQQLDDVIGIYNGVLKTVKSANKAFVSEKGETYSNLAEETKAEIRRNGKEQDKEGLLKPLTRKFFLNNAIPVWFFDNLYSKTLIKLFNNIADAEGEWGQIIEDGKSYRISLEKKYGVKEWDVDKTFSFRLKSGKNFELTLGQIMSLYAFAKQGDEAKNHLFNGGVVYAKSIILKDSKSKKHIVRPGSAFRLSEEVLVKMFSVMEQEAPQSAEYIDEMVAYLSGNLAEKGNDVAEKLYGIRLFNKKYYFPIRSSSDFIKAKEQKSAGQSPRLKNWGATNERVPNATNPIVLDNFLDVWSHHVNEMASFATFTLPLEDMERVIDFNTRADPKDTSNNAESVKGVISTIYGREYVEYIEKLIDHLNGGARVDNITGFANTFMGLAKSGATALSLSTLVQQPTSIFRAMAFIHPKYFTQDHAKIKGHAAEWAELQKYAPIAIIKEMGGYDTGLGAKTTQYLKTPDYKGISEKAVAFIKDSSYRNEVIFKAPALADEITWCQIWAATKKEVADKNKALTVGSEAYYKACGARFTDIVRHTQVYDSVLARSPIMRSKDFGAKLVTAFAAEPTVSINMYNAAVVAAKNGEGKKAVALISANVASMIACAIVSSFVYAARDDDEDETYPEKYLQSLVTEVLEGINPITYLPLLRDVWSIMQGYDIERLDVSIISDAWKAIEGLTSSRRTPWQKIRDFLGTLSQLFGVPLKNIFRESEAIINLFKMMADGEHTDIEGVVDSLLDAAEQSIPLLEHFLPEE